MDLQNITTDEVRRDFIVTNLGWFPALTGAEVEAGFDKWLAGVQRDARAEALEGARDEFSALGLAYSAGLLDDRTKALRAGQESGR